MLEQAQALGEMLMMKHGLTDWTFGFHNKKTIGGNCYGVKKHIALSRHYVTNTKVTDSQIVDTILHEIAHALVGREHGHDEVWRQKAKEIGSLGERCLAARFTQEQWIVYCPCGRVHVGRHRVQKRLLKKCCQVCGGTLAIKHI